ncbi:MAG: metallophosphoesterase [Bacteroidales bacterium]
MKYLKTLQLPIILILLVLSSVGCDNKSIQKDDESFSFIFMTDIHLQEELDAVNGFKMAIDSINSLNPDFVINGGDMIMDALGQRYGKQIHSIISILKPRQDRADLFTTIGNHDIFSIYKRFGTDATHIPIMVKRCLRRG